MIQKNNLLKSYFSKILFVRLIENKTIWYKLALQNYTNN